MGTTNPKKNHAQTIRDESRSDAVRASDAAHSVPRAAPSASHTAPSLPATVHPLVWALQLWVIASVVSLVLSAGLSRALRGAYVGAESWILYVDHSAALTSQVAAICTALLLVYMGMLSARASRSFLVGLSGSVLGVAPTLVLFYAHRFPMPQFFTWLAAACGTFVLWVSAFQSKTNTPLRFVVGLGGLTLAGATLRAGGIDGDGTSFLSDAGSLLMGFFGWCTIIAALVLHLWLPKRKPVRGALLLGLSLLLASTASAATQPEAARWIQLTGRTLTELTSSGVLAGSGPLALSLALLLLISTLFSRPGSLAQLICAILAISVVSPPSPLVIAWLTLCGYVATVVAWEPDKAMK